MGSLPELMLDWFDLLKPTPVTGTVAAEGTYYVDLISIVH